MSRMILSWLSSWKESREPQSPLTMARLERRLRTEADDMRISLPNGTGRRTLSALREIEMRGGFAQRLLCYPEHFL